MPHITADDLNDLVKGTLRNLGPPSFSDIAQELQNYEVMSKWFKKDKVVLDDGYGIKRILMNRVADSAAHVGLLDSDVSSITDVLDEMVVPWRYVETKWSVIYEETLMNRGKSLITNIIKPRRASAMLSLAAELEARAWAAPSSSSDTKMPYGLPYWVVKNTSTGFNGGAASGHTTVAGVDLTNSPTFKNYTATYTTVSKPDLITKLRTAKRKCVFISPIDLQDYRNGKGERYRLYVNEATMASLEDVGEAQNENLGKDIASIDGMSMMFRGHPIIWVPQLDSDTNNPIYMIDHTTFYPCVLKGDFMRETVKQNPDNHDVTDTFNDTGYNYICINRRANAVVYINN